MQMVKDSLSPTDKRQSLVAGGKFIAKDLFGPSKLGKYHNPRTLHESDDGYEFICASVRNNGINSAMPKVDGENLSLTPPNIIAWGKQSPFFTYHENPCVTSQGMYFIEVNNLTRNQIHFVITVLNKLTSGYNYTNCLIGKKFDELSVPLPLKPGTDEVNYTEDDIDWDYIESYIHELEESYIHELDAYLKETGLDDYELTDAEQALLEREPMFREFKVGDLFDVTQGRRLKKSDFIDGDIPFVMASSRNNGVVAYLSNPVTTNENFITADILGNVFYHDGFVGFGDDNCGLKLKNGKDLETIYLYLVGALSCFKSIASYGNKLRGKWYKEQFIKLPVKPGTDEVNYTEDDIDWDYMESYIRAMEKHVIADVVDYKNSEITTAKELVYV